MIRIDGYLIDAAISEDHAFDSEVTAHPVEDGADVTDHVRARPITITVEGVVTDTPIGSAVAERGDDALPSEDAFARIMAIRDAREPVTIETSLGTFDNMVLQAFAVPRSSGNGESLRFRASFVQVQLVTTERTIVKVAVPRAAKKKNLGAKPSAELGGAGARAVPAKAVENQSILDEKINGGFYLTSGTVIPGVN